MILALILGVIAGAIATVLLDREGASLDFTASCSTQTLPDGPILPGSTPDPLDSDGEVGLIRVVELAGIFSSKVPVGERPGGSPILIVVATPPEQPLTDGSVDELRVAARRDRDVDRAVLGWLRDRDIDLDDPVRTAPPGSMLDAQVMKAREARWSTTVEWISAGPSEAAPVAIEAILFDVDGTMVEREERVSC